MGKGSWGEGLRGKGWGRLHLGCKINILIFFKKKEEKKGVKECKCKGKVKEKKSREAKNGKEEGCEEEYGQHDMYACKKASLDKTTKDVKGMDRLRGEAVCL